MDNVIYPDNNFIAAFSLTTYAPHFLTLSMTCSMNVARLNFWNGKLLSSQVRSKKKNGEVSIENVFCKVEARRWWVNLNYSPTHCAHCSNINFRNPKLSEDEFQRKQLLRKFP